MPDTLREALTSAFASAESAAASGASASVSASASDSASDSASAATPPPVATPAEPPPAPAASAGAQAKADTPASTAASAATASSAPPAPTPPTDKAAQSPADSGAAVPQKDTSAQNTQIDPAPVSWKPSEKAHWAGMPAEARAAVLRREAEIQRALQTSAEARKLAQSFEQVMQPYAPLLQKYGVTDPLEAVGALFQTRAALELGTPEQKAQLVANLVHNFGVDIKMLDEAIVRGPQQVAPSVPSFNPRSMPEFKPVFDLVEQIQQAYQTKAQQMIDEVSQLPHFEDVREDMADLIEAAAKRGRSLSVREAYDRAIALAGLQGPAQVPAGAGAPAAGAAPAGAATPPQSISEAAAMLARAKRASSSVAGAPKMSPGDKPKSLRDTIEAAMNSAA